MKVSDEMYKCKVVQLLALQIRTGGRDIAVNILDRGARRGGLKAPRPCRINPGREIF
jgi:hypothetical protein